MSLSSLLNKSVTVQRPSITQDASAGSVRSFQDLADASEVPAAIQPISYRERMQFGGRQLFITHVVYFDQDYGVKRGDIVKDLTTEPVKTYIVLSYQNQAGQDFLYAVYAREQML